MAISKSASIIIQDGLGGIEVVSRLNVDCEVVPINDGKKNGFLASQYGVLLSLTKVIRILNEYECVLTNLPIHHLVFSIINIYFRKKHIAVEHGPWIFAIGMKTNVLVCWLYHLWLKYSSCRVVCVSKDLYCLYNLIRKDNIYIPNCISPINNVRYHSTLGNEVRCVFVGRFDKQKDVELAIKSFIDFAETQQIRCSLDLYGDGGEFKMLAEKYKDDVRISFLGYFGDVRNKLFNYDVCIVSSHFEGLPGIVLEALYVGCRVVCAPFIAGLLELSEFPNLGVANSRDIVDISKQIRASLVVEFEPNEIRKKLEGRYCQKSIRERYNNLIIFK